MLGEAVEQLRIEKNISVKDLIGERISKSTYSRFVNNKSMVSADTLLYLLNQLHTTFAMFLQLHTDYFDLKYDYTILNHCLELKQTYRLSNLLKKWELKIGHLSIPEELFIKTIKITLADLNGELATAISLDELREVYDELNYWTDYNLKSFKASMHLFDTQTAIKYAKKILKNIDNIDGTLVHEEVFYVLGRVFSRCLMEGLNKDAKEIYSNLNRLYISQYDLGKQIYAMYYEGLANVILLNKFDDIKLINDAIDYWDLLHMTYRIDEFCTIYEAASHHMDLPELRRMEGGHIDGSRGKDREIT